MSEEAESPLPFPTRMRRRVDDEIRSELELSTERNSVIARLNVVNSGPLGQSEEVHYDEKNEDTVKAFNYLEASETEESFEQAS